jgi:hypothetical protein
MAEKKDYSKLTLEELFDLEKKIRKNEMYAALGVGFLVGVMVFGVVRNGFGFLYTFIPIVFILVIFRNSKVQKESLAQILLEIKNRNVK